ncbi:hypothetical protein GEMRC1_006188 [Eukaryota sp. GEM-RC1]
MSISPVDYPLFTSTCHNLVCSGVKRRSVHCSLDSLLSNKPNSTDSIPKFCSDLHNIALQITDITQEEDPLSSTFSSLLSDSTLSQLQASPYTASATNSSRIDRLIYEYLVRRGYSTTATLFLQSLPSTSLVQCITRPFEIISAISLDLKNSNTSSATEWILNVPASSSVDFLKFKIFTFDSCLLAKSGNWSKSILTFNSNTKDLNNDTLRLECSKLIGRCFLFAKTPTQLDSLLQQQRDQIIELITREVLSFFRLGCNQTLLETVVRTGLAALATPFCTGKEGDCVFGCPTCKGPLAESRRRSEVPSALRTVTVLRCPVTGADFSNSDAVALPNGNVLSPEALIHKGNFVIDPITNEEFRERDLKRVYIP